MSDANEPTSSDGGSSTNQQHEPSDPEPSFIQRAYEWVRRKVYPRRIRAIALGLNNCGKTTLLNHLQMGEPQYRVFIPTVVAQVYDVEYKDTVFQVRVVQRHSSHLPSVRCRGPAHLPPTCRIRVRTVYWLCQSCVFAARIDLLDVLSRVIGAAVCGYVRLPEQGGGVAGLHVQHGCGHLRH